MVNGIIFILEDGRRLESKHPRPKEKVAQLEKFLTEGTLRAGETKVTGLELL